MRGADDRRTARRSAAKRPALDGAGKRADAESSRASASRPGGKLRAKPGAKPSVKPGGKPSARVRALLARMTLAEKLGQLNMASADYAVTGPVVPTRYLEGVRKGAVGAILNLWGEAAARAVQTIAVEETRLGIPLLLCFDVIHGHRTIFPTPLAETCAFDPALWEATARVAAREASADALHLTFAPMLDVCRDPRWGRIVEGPGESAFVGARLAEAKVRGYQGESLSAPDAVAATAKHFIAYGASLGGRDYAQVDVSARDLLEVYRPPFAAAVNAGVAAVMPAFNDLDGVPMTANAAMLQGALRRDLGFSGVTIADYNAVAELVEHGVARDLAAAAASAVEAGLDVDMISAAFVAHLGKAVRQKRVAMKTIDAAVARVLTLKERLGLFENPYRIAPAPTPQEAQAHRALAREAGRRAIVLLQNKGDALPLAATVKRVALIGPFAEARKEMLGSWASIGDPASAVTFREGLEAALPDAEIRHVAGCDVFGQPLEGQSLDLAAVRAAARWADVAILCVGEPAEWSGEAASRARLDLPGRQRELVEATLANARRSVVSISSGRPLVLPWLTEKADALLATWQLGHEAGHAFADVVTGACDATGRLALSWPWDVGQIPVFHGRRRDGRPFDAATKYSSKYLDVPNKPLFPFGHGLSYARFVFAKPKLSTRRLAKGGTVTVRVAAENASARAGEATLFLFLRRRTASVSRPDLDLKGFAKVALAPGEKGVARFELTAQDFVFPDATLTPVFEPGDVEIVVGPSAREADLLGASLTLVGAGSRKA